MAAMSNYLENKLLDALFRGQSFTFPSTLYIALYTAAPTAAGGGTEVSTTSTGYARVKLSAGATLALTDFNATQGGTAAVSSGTTGQTSNANTITFGAPTANWGQVVAIAILDAASGGNELFFANLTTPKTVNSGDPAPTLAAGALTLTLS